MGLTLMIFCVEKFVRNSFLMQQVRKGFIFINRCSSHQNGPSCFVLFCDIFDDCIKLPSICFENHVRMICSSSNLIGGDDQYVCFIYFAKLFGFSCGSTRHSCKFFIHAEVVLERYGGKSSRFLFDRDPFFSFDSLM